MMEGLLESLQDDIGATWSLVAEMFCSVINEGVELDDVDAAILFEYVNCTGMHISNVVRILRPGFASADRDERAEALNDLIDHPLPGFGCACGTQRDHVAELASAAVDYADDAYWAVRELGNDDVLDELDHALAHLDTVRYLLDPTVFEPAPGASDVVRIRLAECRDVCERDLEESRALVRVQIQATWN